MFREISQFISDNLGTIIAIIALLSTIIFSILQQKHNRNSVRPHLAVSTYNFNEKICVKIKNCGMGPMIIKPLHITINGNKRDDLFLCFLEAIDSDDIKSICKFYEFFVRDFTREGTVISPNDERELLLIKAKTEIDLNENVELKRAIATLLKTLRKIDFVVIYFDVYGKKFVKKEKLSDSFTMRYEEYLENHEETREPTTV